MVISTPRQAEGFTLPELLIASFISGLLVMGAGQIMLSQMRTDERMEAVNARKANGRALHPSSKPKPPSASR